MTYGGIYSTQLPTKLTSQDIGAIHAVYQAARAGALRPGDERAEFVANRLANPTPQASSPSN
jgi:hypothetical protein